MVVEKLVNCVFNVPLYKCESAEEDKELIAPTDFTDLGGLISTGISYKKRSQARKIAVLDSKKQNFLSEIAKKKQDIKKNEVKGSGVSELDKDYVKQEILKLQVAVRNLNKEVAELEIEQQGLETTYSHLADHIASVISKDLQPCNAESLGEGFVYVLLEDSKVAGFEKLKLYAEYKSTMVDEELIYNRLDISEYEDCDYRVASEDNPTEYINLPSCYVKDGELDELKKVVVLYSHAQLSSERLDKLESDASLQSNHARSLKVSDLKDNFEASLVGNEDRAKKVARDLVDKYKDEVASQADWQGLEVYPILDESKAVRWSLLLDDKLGVLNNNNYAIDWVQTQLSKLCVDIQAEPQSRSCVYVANFLYDPQASGLLDVDRRVVEGLSLKFHSYDDGNKRDNTQALITGWLSKDSRLKEINHTRTIIDIDTLRYHLRSKSRMLLRSLMKGISSTGTGLARP